jgi:hypothetical protein
MDMLRFNASHYFSVILYVLGLLIIGTVISRRYLYTISRIPGPWLASITRLWHAYHIFQGDHNTLIIKLHQDHGQFVRIAPNEVSVSPSRWPKASPPIYATQSE